MTGALARQDIAVLRLTQTGKQTVALLAAATGPAASLLTARSAGNGGHWELSPRWTLSVPIQFGSSG